MDQVEWLKCIILTNKKYQFKYGSCLTCQTCTLLFLLVFSSKRSRFLPPKPSSTTSITSAKRMQERRLKTIKFQKNSSLAKRQKRFFLNKLPKLLSMSAKPFDSLRSQIRLINFFSASNKNHSLSGYGFH